MRFYSLVFDMFMQDDVAYESGSNNRDRVWVRSIDVPDEEYRDCHPRDDGDVLESIFKWGQNDFQPKVAPSLSVDDIVIVPYRGIYRVAGLGFEPVEPNKLSPYQRLIIRMLNEGQAHVVIECQNNVARDRLRMAQYNRLARLRRFENELKEHGR